MSTEGFSCGWHRETHNGEKFLVYTVRHQSRIIAELVLQHTRTKVRGREANGYFVDDIQVADEWKKLGLGKHLLSVAIGVIERRKAFGVLYDGVSEKKDPHAKDWYRRNGWTPVGDKLMFTQHTRLAHELHKAIPAMR